MVRSLDVVQPCLDLDRAQPQTRPDHAALPTSRRGPPAGLDLYGADCASGRRLGPAASAQALREGVVGARREAKPMQRSKKRRPDVSFYRCMFADESKCQKVGIYFISRLSLLCTTRAWAAQAAYPRFYRWHDTSWRFRSRYGDANDSAKANRA